MRILSKNLKTGKVVVRPETPTDLYIISSIIFEEDQVIGRTSRRVHKGSSEGEKKSGDKGERVSMTLSLSVAAIDYQDTRLRIRGRIVQGPEKLVALGDWHTLNVDLGSTVTIIKTQWSRYELEQIEQAEKASKKPKVCVIVIDAGEATLAVIDNFRISIIGHHRIRIPRKGSKSKNRDKIQNDFFLTVGKDIQLRVDPEIIHFVIGGPGFAKEKFSSFLNTQDLGRDVSMSVESTATASRTGVEEIIARGAVDRIVESYQVLQESQVLEEFLKRLAKGESTVAYGLEEVTIATEMGAIEMLLVEESLLRPSDYEEGEKVRNLLKKIEKLQGNYMIVSALSDHVKQLRGLGSIIALLRYPVFLSEISSE